MKHFLVTSLTCLISVSSFASVIPINGKSTLPQSYGYCHGLIANVQYNVAKNNVKYIKVELKDPKMPHYGKSNCSGLVFIGKDLSKFNTLSKSIGSHFVATSYSLQDIKELDKLNIKKINICDQEYLDDCEDSKINTIDDFQINKFDSKENDRKNKFMNSIFNEDDEDDGCEEI